jgi:hypothetical protein
MHRSNYTLPAEAAQRRLLAAQYLPPTDPPLMGYIERQRSPTMAAKRSPGGHRAGGDKFQFRQGNRELALSYRQAFACGHALVEQQRFAEARQIFRVLAAVAGRGPRARIMLARCEAGLGQFKLCRQILGNIFRHETHPVWEELAAAFVLWQLGLRGEAARALAHVIGQYPNLPTVCLLLGERFAAARNDAKAGYCFRLAIRRDNAQGAVSAAARQHLAALRKRRARRQAASRKRRPR